MRSLALSILFLSTHLGALVGLTLLPSPSLTPNLAFLVYRPFIQSVARGACARSIDRRNSNAQNLAAIIWRQRIRGCVSPPIRDRLVDTERANNETYPYNTSLAEASITPHSAVGTVAAAINFEEAVLAQRADLVSGLRAEAHATADAIRNTLADLLPPLWGTTVHGRTAVGSPLRA